MTKKINKASIIQRLTLKYLLQEHEAEDFVLSEKVIPVTEIDSLLKLLNCTSVSGIAVSATASYTVLTVPANKRYTVRGVEIWVASGTWTMNELQIVVATVTMPIHKEASGVTTLFKYLDTPIRLEPGQTIGVYVNSYTGAGNMSAKILYEEEDAY